MAREENEQANPAPEEETAPVESTEPSGSAGEPVPGEQSMSDDMSMVQGETAQEKITYVSDQAQKWSTRVNQGTQAITSVINPVTGIILLVIVVVVALVVYASAASQTLGRNSNACKNGEDCSIAKGQAVPNCSSSISILGSGGSEFTGAWPEPGSPEAIGATYKLLVQAGLSEPDAYLLTAIVGLESNWNPNPPGQTASSPYAGLFQMGVSEASAYGGYSAADRLDPVKAADMGAKLYMARGAQPWAGWPGSNLSILYASSNPRDAIINTWKTSIVSKVQQVLGGPGFSIGTANDYDGPGTGKSGKGFAAWGVKGVTGDPPYGTGTVAVSTDGGSTCVGDGVGGGVLGGDIVTVAQGIAWPDGRKVTCCGGSGRDVSMPGYLTAKASAQQKGGVDPIANLFASCDRFVATVLKNTVDTGVPWGSSDTQYAYFAGSPKWASRTGALQPGDILTTNGHILIYLKPGLVAQSSYLSYTATQSRESWPASASGNYTVPWDSRVYKAYYFKG